MAPPPAPLDVSSIVPSTRDFLQAIATQRKRLALVPLVDHENDARRLADAGVSALAVHGPDDTTRAISAAAGSLPLISLLQIDGEDDALRARAAGIDAVLIEATRFDALSRAARSTRMAALAVGSDPSLETTVGGAKAIYLRLSSVEQVGPIVAKLPKGLRVLVHVPNLDETSLRALRGVVDAAIVEQDLHLSTSFDTLREELDP